MPSSTSSAAASAASRFSRSKSALTPGNPTAAGVDSVSVTAWAGASGQREVEVEPSIYAADFSRLGEQLGALVGGGRAGLPLRRRRRPLHPRDHHRPGRARVDRAARPRVGSDARLPSDGRAPGAPLRGVRRARAGTASRSTWRPVEDPAGRDRARARSSGSVSVSPCNPETAVEEAAGAAEGADLVLCMSIHPGYSGQAFMPEATERIERLRAGSSRRRCACRSTAASTRRRSARPGPPAPTCSSPAVRSSGTTIPRSRTESSSSRSQSRRCRAWLGDASRDCGVASTRVASRRGRRVCTLRELFDGDLAPRRAHDRGGGRPLPRLLEAPRRRTTRCSCCGSWRSSAGSRSGCKRCSAASPSTSRRDALRSTSRSACRARARSSWTASTS